MQTLGLSDSTPRTEGRLKALFWPTIRNEFDVDYITRQGFWLCLIIATLTLILGLFTGPKWAAVAEFLFFFLGGVGIRQRSRFAAMAVFLVYLLSTPNFGIVRIIFLGLLLANVRGIWLSARWSSSGVDPLPESLSPTFTSKLAEALPPFLWPKTRILFYLFAALEFAGVLAIWLARFSRTS
jgi:hypothetical protein